ncbi:MAG TPA: protein kinase, partial [Candidatus Acidoferrum sp.]|nr:protein kinase [Candidatus Acidoferrum sp.]
MSTIVIEAQQCPNCGKLMAGGPLAGLCPACLLAQGSADTQAAHKPPFVPPPIEEVRKLFPQLEIVSLLGAGGMGAVYKARQSALDRWVALKVLPAENSSGVNFAERFNREARALAKLSHPNIVTVHEFGQVGTLHFFIMEFVDGTNLRQLEQSGRFSSREALQVIPQICDALQYAHDEGVVHRDIKPENVLIDRKGRVKIADFGLAKIMGADPNAQRLTMEGQVMGTPHYMAPEQVEKPLSVDHRADIYALGVVFYEMLTGDLPLGKFPPPSRKFQLDIRLDDVVLRALENDPALRYQNASEVKSQVETIAGSPGEARSQQGNEPVASAAETSTAGKFHYWAGFPVVVQRGDERSVNWSGTLLALAAALLSMLPAFLLFRMVSGHSNISAALPLGSVLAALLVMLGVRRALKRTDENPRTETGTVIIPRLSWWRSERMAFVIVPLFILAWSSFALVALVPKPRERSGEKNGIHVRQVAGENPRSGALVAKLSGGTVELLAVNDADAGPESWWTPRGKWLGEVGYEIRNAMSYHSKDRTSKDFVLRMRDLPDGASMTGAQIESASTISSGGQVFHEGSPVHGALPIRAAVRSSDRRATLLCGFGIKPWRTVATIDPTGAKQSLKREHGDPRWAVTVHHQPIA